MASRTTEAGFRAAERPASSAVLGWWTQGDEPPARDRAALDDALWHIGTPFFVVDCESEPAAARGGRLFSGARPEGESLAVLAFVPACPVQNLGDRGFMRDYNLIYPLVAGSMAHGISSVRMVSALADAGFMSFFGAAGLAPGAVEEAVDELTLRCDGKPWGCNLIHSPSEPALERALADIYIRKNVRLIEASAYIDFTLPLVDFRLHGIHRMSDGRVIAPNRIIAKVSRAELASRFFAPPPESLTRELVLQGRLTDEQADMARRIPVAQDVTAEADSGGHTDNRPAPALLPTLLAVRDRSAAAHSFDVPLRVGAAGGIGTPHGAAAAFAAGAGWIVTGSVNQACLESGTSEAVKQILAETQQADVMMAPAADMFELGVKVQVLKRATMFPMRAAKLHEIYHRYNSIEAIPAAERAALEKNIFRLPIDEVWRRTQQFFEERDLSQLTRAKDEPKHRMALIFRWYLGQASHWAISGDPSRRIDYQIWCGPAMGAFNEWTQGTFMEKPAGRDVVTVALNILHGAAVLTRMQALRIQGLTLQARVRPLDRARLEEYLA